jgi:hypothetical protein
MEDELEAQLRRVEQTVAEILEAVKNLGDGPGAGQGAAAEVNERLRRFLESKASRVAKSEEITAPPLGPRQNRLRQT